MDETERAELAAMVEHATREDGGISAAELARRAGVSENTIASIKKGRRTYSATAAKLRRALGEPAVIEGATQAPDTAKFAQDLVVMWLMGMPAEDRGQAVKRLVQFIAAESTTGPDSPSIRFMVDPGIGRSD